MIIPILLLINFAFTKSAVGDYAVGYGDRFNDGFWDEYQQVFGENQEDLSSQQRSIIFLYFSGTFLINIVCLNILISVVTDNYDLVMQRIEAEDCKFKAKKLYSNERVWQLLYSITNFCCKISSQRGQKYLFIVRYHFVTGKEDNSAGKFKELQKSIEKVHSDISHTKTELMQEIEKVPKEVN